MAPRTRASTGHSSPNKPSTRSATKSKAQAPSARVKRSTNAENESDTPRKKTETVVKEDKDVLELDESIVFVKAGPSSSREKDDCSDFEGPSLVETPLILRNKNVNSTAACSPPLQLGLFPCHRHSFPPSPLLPFRYCEANMPAKQPSPPMGLLHLRGADWREMLDMTMPDADASGEGSMLWIGGGATDQSIEMEAEEARDEPQQATAMKAEAIAEAVEGSRQLEWNLDTMALGGPSALPIGLGLAALNLDPVYISHAQSPPTVRCNDDPTPERLLFNIPISIPSHAHNWRVPEDGGTKDISFNVEEFLTQLGGEDVAHLFTANPQLGEDAQGCSADHENSPLFQQPGDETARAFEVMLEAGELNDLVRLQTPTTACQASGPDIDLTGSPSPSTLSASVSSARASGLETLEPSTNQNPSPTPTEPIVIRPNPFHCLDQPNTQSVLPEGLIVSGAEDNTVKGLPSPHTERTETAPASVDPVTVFSVSPQFAADYSHVKICSVATDTTQSTPSRPVIIREEDSVKAPDATPEFGGSLAAALEGASAAPTQKRQLTAFTARKLPQTSASPAGASALEAVDLSLVAKAQKGKADGGKVREAGQVKRKSRLSPVKEGLQGQAVRVGAPLPRDKGGHLYAPSTISTTRIIPNSLDESVASGECATSATSLSVTEHSVSVLAAARPPSAPATIKSKLPAPTARSIPRKTAPTPAIKASTSRLPAGGIAATAIQIPKSVPSASRKANTAKAGTSASGIAPPKPGSAASSSGLRQPTALRPASVASATGKAALPSSGGSGRPLTRRPALALGSTSSRGPPHGLQRAAPNTGVHRHVVLPPRPASVASSTGSSAQAAGGSQKVVSSQRSRSAANKHMSIKWTAESPVRSKPDSAPLGDPPLNGNRIFGQLASSAVDRADKFTPDTTHPTPRSPSRATNLASQKPAIRAPSTPIPAESTSFQRSVFPPTASAVGPGGLVRSDPATLSPTKATSNPADLPTAPPEAADPFQPTASTARTPPSWAVRGRAASVASGEADRAPTIPEDPLAAARARAALYAQNAPVPAPTLVPASVPEPTAPPPPPEDPLAAARARAAQYALPPRSPAKAAPETSTPPPEPENPLAAARARASAFALPSRCPATPAPAADSPRPAAVTPAAPLEAAEKKPRSLRRARSVSEAKPPPQAEATCAVDPVPPARPKQRRAKSASESKCGQTALTDVQLKRITHQNTTRNGAHFNRLDVRVEFMNRARPPSPSSKIRRSSGGAGPGKQPAKAMREDRAKRRALRESTDAARRASGSLLPEEMREGERHGDKGKHFFGAGDETGGYWSPIKERSFGGGDATAAATKDGGMKRKRAKKDVKWDRALLVQRAEDGLSSPSAAKRRGIEARGILKDVDLDHLGNVPEALQPLPSEVGRTVVVIVKRVYDDDESD